MAGLSHRRRRGWFLVAGLLLLVAMAAAAWWFLWVPTWRSPLQAGERYGIDVSAHQGAVDWRRVRNDDIEFAYVKATEGGDFTDRRFAENWRAAAEARVERGPYHFFTLCTPGEAQAAHFLRVAPPEEGALAPPSTLELLGNCRRRPPAADVYRELDAFLGQVESAWGGKAVLYVGDEFDRRYPVRKRYGRPLWHRRFLLWPDVDGWVVWQLHGLARVDGVSGTVDLNVEQAR
jgi:lysozyme